MNNIDNVYPSELVSTLQSGGIAVLLTDTIYGIIGRANNKTTVEQIYAAKGRTPNKSPIVLIGNTSDMLDRYDEATLKMLKNYWPGKNSIILPSSHGPTWLTRGNQSIAYRLPANEPLQELLKLTGPLIAPSANPEGLTPAATIDQAKSYFGDKVDHYLDGGIVLDQAPSSLFKYQDETLIKLW